jgi:hypothetical protein
MQLSTCFLGRLLGFEELPLVTTPVGGIEYRHSDEAGGGRFVPALDGVYENRKAGAVFSEQVEGNLIEEPLHTQQRSKVGLVVDPTGNMEELLKAAADQRLALIPGPREEGLVDLYNRAIRQ